MKDRPTFDEWFAAKNHGMTFEEMYQIGGLQFTDTMRALTRETRDYVTEMMRETDKERMLRMHPPIMVKPE